MRDTCKRCGCSLLGLRKDALWCSEACRKAATRDKAARARQRAARPDKARTGGLQVSYRKAVEHIAQTYGPGLRHSEAIAAAEALLRPALSDRQRAQLDERP